MLTSTDNGIVFSHSYLWLLYLYLNSGPVLLNVPDHSTTDNFAFQCRVGRKVGGRTNCKPINVPKDIQLHMLISLIVLMDLAKCKMQ